MDNLPSYSEIRSNPNKEAEVRALAEIVRTHPITEIRTEDTSYHEAAVILENWYVDACHAALHMIENERDLYNQVFTALRRAYQAEKARTSVDGDIRMPVSARSESYYRKLLSNLMVLNRADLIAKYVNQAREQGIIMDIGQIEKPRVDYNPFQRGKRINFARDQMEISAEVIQKTVE